MDLLIYAFFPKKKKLIYAFSLHHSKCIDNELFVKSTRSRFQPYITLFTKYLALIIIECNMYYISLKKEKKNLPNLKNIQIININSLI